MIGSLRVNKFIFLVLIFFSPLLQCIIFGRWSTHRYSAKWRWGHILHRWRGWWDDCNITGKKNIQKFQLYLKHERKEFIFFIQCQNTWVVGRIEVVFLRWSHVSLWGSNQRHEKKFKVKLSHNLIKYALFFWGMSQPSRGNYKLFRSFFLHQTSPSRNCA